MAKYWKSKQFEELKSKWDQKLKESGFNDAEKEVAGELVLKRISVTQGREGGVYRHLQGPDKHAARTEKEDYYRILSQCFHDEREFDDDLDRLIMERTAEGKTINEISAELKGKLSEGQKRGKWYRNTIRFIRRRYENKWGIRKWEPHQMVSRKAIR